MADIHNASEKLAQLLREKGITKAAWTTAETETREFTADSTGFRLFRTLYGAHFSLTLYREGRKGSVVGNDLSEAALERAVEEAYASAEAAPADDANDIAPFAGRETFTMGSPDCDEELLFARLKELREGIAAEYPRVLLMESIARHDREHSLYRNTNGTEFEVLSGNYEVVAEFAGHEGEVTTGLDYCGFAANQLDRPMLDCGALRQHLESAEAQLNGTELRGKFTGPVVFTPDCLGSMLRYVMGSYLSGSVVLNGTGLWNDKLGQKVADERISFGLCPLDERIVGGSPYTGDGFRTVNLPLLEKGVLQNQILNLYTANKTGRKPSCCGGGNVVMQAGDTPLSEILAGVERGLLVGGFSGGEPGTNGELSGVAKNAFLIEKGKVIGAVSETMISTNLEDMLRQVRAISTETVEDGWSVLPWMAVDGVVISGKE